MEKQYLSEKEFTNLQSFLRVNFVYFILQSIISNASHITTI